jgi:hypothetical protein
LILDKASIGVLSEIRALSVETIAVPKAISSRTGFPLEGWAIGLALLAVLLVAWAWLFRMGAVSVIHICRVHGALEMMMSGL